MSGSIAVTTLSSVYNNSFTQYLKHSETIGGEIFDQSITVNNVFKYTLELIRVLSGYAKPMNPSAERNIIDPLFEEIAQVKAFESKTSEFVFQITLISKSIKVFEWVREPDAEVFITRLHKYIQFYQQKALCEIEGIGRTHFEWLKCWNETYEEFSVFIVNFFKKGLSWSGQKQLPAGNVLGDIHSLKRHKENESVLKDIGTGETIKNPLYRLSPAFEESSSTQSVITKEGQIWSIQNQKNKHKDLILNTAKKEDNVCIDNCEDCTVVIESFVNVIQLSVCKRVTVLFRQSSKLEAVNCTDCNFHCFDKISGLEMKSCDNCGIYLSDKSLESSIITTKSSRINVSFPFADGLYQNFKISDHLKTVILPNKGIETTIE